MCSGLVTSTYKCNHRSITKSHVVASFRKVPGALIGDCRKAGPPTSNPTQSVNYSTSRHLITVRHRSMCVITINVMHYLWRAAATAYQPCDFGDQTAHTASSCVESAFMQASEMPLASHFHIGIGYRDSFHQLVLRVLYTSSACACIAFPRMKQNSITTEPCLILGTFLTWDNDLRYLENQPAKLCGQQKLLLFPDQWIYHKMLLHVVAASLHAIYS